MDEFEKCRGEYKRYIKEQKLLSFLSGFENLESKIKLFYEKSGKERLIKFKESLAEKTGFYPVLHWNEKRGLFGVHVRDYGLELDFNDNTFCWANVFSQNTKEPFLKILKEYKSILEQV